MGYWPPVHFSLEVASRVFFSRRTHSLSVAIILANICKRRCKPRMSRRFFLMSKICLAKLHKPRGRRRRRRQSAVLSIEHLYWCAITMVPDTGHIVLAWAVFRIIWCFVYSWFPPAIPTWFMFSSGRTKSSADITRMWFTQFACKSVAIRRVVMKRAVSEIQKE